MDLSKPRGKGEKGKEQAWSEQKHHAPDDECIKRKEHARPSYMHKKKEHISCNLICVLFFVY